jgi:Fur family ferric uptake transcriptional regulator
MNTNAMKMTKQRKTILDELRKVKSHPTADELYGMVRKKMPRISLGTVYRNLELLSQNGIVTKLGKPGEQKRFDGDTSSHYHFFCRKCKRVYDIEPAEIPELQDSNSKIKGHSIEQTVLNFYGCCENCND